MHLVSLRLLGAVRTRLHLMKPTFYGTLLRLKTKLTTSEVEALLPFDGRMWYQNLPIEGKDDVLFHRDHDAIEQFDGGIVFRERQLAVWTRALSARQAWCEAHGSQFRMLIVPEKHIVYADKLPAGMRISPRRPAIQLRDALDPELAAKVLYVSESLREARRRYDTFYKADTHWTGYGAFLGYRAIVDSLASDLKLEAVGEDELVFREHHFIGDIGVRFFPERGDLALLVEPPVPFRLVFKNGNFGRGAVHVYESERRDLPSCVLFRDSFANAMIPLLMRSFSRVVAVSSLTCHFDLLEQEKPDLVLFEIVERFIASFVLDRAIVLPEDDKAIPFAAVTGTELCELQRVSQ